MRLYALLFLIVASHAERRNRRSRHENSEEEAEERALLDKHKYAHRTATSFTSNDQLPTDFSWCKNNGVNYCLPSWNQHQPRYCGGCWVHGSLAAAQDRINIEHIKNNFSGAPVLLARQDMFTCAREYGFGAGCNGGDPDDVYEYMARYGLPDETCNNFLAADGKCNPNGRCQNCMPNGDDLSNFTCWPVKDYVTYYVSEYGYVKGEQHIMQEVYARGPVVCNMACPENFVYAYHNGIFRDVTLSHDVDHDVEVVGWGEENGQKYWTIRNSWGSYWGEGGFFRVARGDDALLIESMGCVFPLMDLSDEKRLENGKMVGSMYGIVPQEVAAQYSMPFHDYPKEWLMQMRPPNPSHKEIKEGLVSTPPPVVNHEAKQEKPNDTMMAFAVTKQEQGSVWGMMLIVGLICAAVAGVLYGRWTHKDYEVI